MATATLVRADVVQSPVSFVPPGDRSVRLSHLDPRPLWAEPAGVASAWRSPSFWLAWALVVPVMAVVKVFGRA